MLIITNKSIILSFLIIFSSSILFGLDPHKKINEFKHKVWQYEDGLPQNTIIDIEQTDDGYLWLASKEGILRFDGINFVQFNSETNPELMIDEIWDLYKDSKGNLWIGTNGNGLIKYSIGNFSVYTIEDGLADNVVWKINEDKKGNLWIGTGGGGLNKFIGNNFIHYSIDSNLQSNYIWSIFEDSRGDLWVGTDGAGLFKWRENKFEKVVEFDVLDIEYVFSITEDSKGRLFFGTNFGVVRYENNEFEHLGFNEGIKHNHIWTVFCDKDDNIWAGSEGGGLFLINSYGVNNFNYASGLSGDLISSIFEDNEGNIWVGTKGGGINRFKDKIINTLLTQRNEISNDLTYTVFESPNGTLWIGTSDGLNKIVNGKTQSFSLTDGLSSPIIACITADSIGNIWIGTDGDGINIYKNGTFESITKNNGLTSNSVWSLEFDDNGKLWVGTDGGGINIINKGVVEVVEFEELPSSFISQILRDSKGNMWIASRDQGLFVHEDGKYKGISGLMSQVIWSLYEDSSGVIWVATDRGLNRIIGDKIYSYRESDGLYDNLVYSIIENKKGEFWMTSDEGLFKINEKDLKLFDEGVIKKITCTSFGIDDGMESAECTQGNPSIIKSSEGLLYFTTIKGVAIVDPNNTARKKKNTSVLVEDIRFDGKPVKNNSNIIIPADVSRIEIQYTGFNFMAPNQLNFQYYLEGFDKDWVNAGAARSAVYTQLGPGEYTFHLRSSISGDWNGQESIIHIKKEFQFWQTSLFKLMVLIGIIALVYGLYMYRVRRTRWKQAELESQINERTISLKNEVEERKRKEMELEESRKNLQEILTAKDKYFAIISHDLRSPFQGLLGYSDLLSSEIETFSKTEIADIANSINKLTKNFISQLNNLLQWARIEQGSVEFKSVDINPYLLVDQITKNLVSSINSKEIIVENRITRNYNFKSDENVLTVAVNNILMNAIKYSHKGSKIIIGDLIKEEHVHIYIQDFGIGMPAKFIDNIFNINSQKIRHGTANELGSGLGLSLCNDLIISQGGKILVESEENKGTKFTIEIPIN